MKIELFPKPQLEQLWKEECHLFDIGAKIDRECLRCGRKMKKHMIDNPLSRYADIYICSDCGIDEAIRDTKKDPKPLLHWNAVIHGSVPTEADTAYLTTECYFYDVFEQTKRIPHSSAEVPESQVVYSRSDYNGYRWYTTWFDCQAEKPAPELIKEIDAFHNALFEMPEMKTLDTMRLLCIDAQPTSDDTEYNLYSQTKHFYIWLRLITRNRDYNLYCRYYLK